MAQLELNLDPQGVVTGSRVAVTALDNTVPAATRAERATELLARAYQRLTQPIRRTTVQLRGLFQNLSGNNRFIIQNTANQVGDFAVQVGSGADASRALGQQLPQLLGAFGPLGAVLGTVSAIAIPLGATFLALANDSAETGDSVDVLSEAMSTYVDAAQRASQSSEDLSEEYGALSAQAADLARQQEQLARVQALTALTNQVRELSQEFGNFADLQNRIDAGGRALQGNITSLNTAIGEIADNLGGTDEQARAFAESLERLQRSGSLEEQRQLLAQIREQFLEITGGVDNLDQSQQEFLSGIQQSQQAALDLADGIADVEGGIAGAAVEASGLTAEIENAAAAAADLAANSANALARSRINLEFRNDPIGRAEALARQRVSADTAGLGDGANGPVGVQNLTREINAQNEAFVQNQVEVARTREQLRQLNAEQRAAEAEARRADRAGARGGEASERRRARNAERIAQLREEIAILGEDSNVRGENIVILQQYREVQAAIRSLGPDATQAEIEAVRQLTEERRRLLDINREQADQFEQQLELTREVAGSFIRDFVSGLREGENAWDAFLGAGQRVLDRLTDQILDQLLDAIFQANQGINGLGGGGQSIGGTFLNAFISGLTGGVVPSANGNAFSNGNIVPFQRGGIVDRPTFFSFGGGQTGVAGEAGTEAILPLQRGPNGQLGVQAQFSGNPGVRVEYAPSITVNGNVTDQNMREIQQMLDNQAREIERIQREQIEAPRRNIA